MNENKCLCENMGMDSLIIVRMRKSSYELNSRGDQSKYCLQKNVLTNNDKT